MKKKLLVLGLAILTVVLLTGCGKTEDKDNSDKKKTYGFNETFKYDDFEILVGDNYTFETLENEYSEYDGMDMLKLPITVKNTKSETRSYNESFLAVFGPNGTETKKLAVMSDDDISTADELREGASFTKNMYILYDGDGEYILDFQDEEIEVKLNIKK